MAIHAGSRVIAKASLGLPLAQPTIATVGDDGYEACTMKDCRNPNCKEWATLYDEKDKMICHVPECQMEELLD
jgi:hypothetical protein